MVLSDRSIREEIAAGRIVIDPFDDALVQPCSVDVRVGSAFRVFRNSRYPYIDVKLPMEDLTELVTVADDEPFILHPGEFVLGVVAERVGLPTDIVATLDGKSSLGRLGLVVHQTAGVIDAGFDGHITLELANIANLPITVYPGMRIAQLSFLTLHDAGRAPIRIGPAGLQVPGPGGADPEPLLPELRGRHEGARDRRDRVRRRRGGPAARGRRPQRAGVLARARAATSPTAADVERAMDGVDAARQPGRDPGRERPSSSRRVNAEVPRNVVAAARAARGAPARCT